MVSLWRPVQFSKSIVTGGLPPLPPARRLLHVGERASVTRTFSSQDLLLFAQLTGDANPLHQDSSYARASSFQGPLVHGVLVNGLVSALLGTRLPGGGTVLLHQEIRFPAPLYVGEEVTAEAEVMRIKRNFAFLAVRCCAQDKVVMEGDVVVMVPREALMR